MIEIEHRGTTAILTLAHGKANALDIELCTALSEHLQWLGNDRVRAVVLTGTGSIFSAGVDLVRLLAGGADYIRRFMPAMCTMMRDLFTFQKPLVVAMNGHAIAGGYVIACTADRRLMARGQGRLGITELRVGVPFPDIVMEILRHTLTPVQLKEMAWNGTTYDAQVALARGLADELVEPAGLRDRAIAAAEELAAVPPDVFRFTKMQIRRPALGRIATLDPVLESATTELWESAAAVEAIRDYVNRTLK
jgi:enoyl-CoA hydratase